jgi:hypothetical protein
MNAARLFDTADELIEGFTLHRNRSTIRHWRTADEPVAQGALPRRMLADAADWGRAGHIF